LHQLAQAPTSKLTRLQIDEGRGLLGRFKNASRNGWASPSCFQRLVRSV
jgi:hypothetical protein